MPETANISFRNDDKEIYEWMEKQHEEGDFRNRSHVVVVALKRLKEREGNDIIV